MAKLDCALGPTEATVWPNPPTSAFLPLLVTARSPSTPSPSVAVRRADAATATPL